MADKPSTPQVKASLGLVGASMNAMALIAPGAFLWITYQLQAAATSPSGASVANDIWFGIVVALGIAFLTALSYAELARIYPEAGFASCAYFAEKAFLDDAGKKRTTGPAELARIAKLVTGWAAHLFYWVYPGVMVAMMAELIGYGYNAVTGNTLSNVELVVVGTVFAFVVGYVAYRGVTGSTLTSIWINVIQWISLAVFSGLAIWYRWSDPASASTLPSGVAGAITHNQWAFSSAWDVIKPHSLNGVLIQSTLAILILVGFESATALSAETKEPEKNIPKAILLALFVQGVLAYLLEYFATGYAISDHLVNVSVAAAPAAAAVTGTATAAVAAVPASVTTVATAMAAAGASSAPIGDLSQLFGATMLHGIGFGLMITIGITVAIAIFGTTLSCFNTAVRVTNGMANDRELPDFLGFLHGSFATPHTALWTLVVVSCVIAAVGVQSVVGLTGITLASNFGTFILYGLTCVWTIVAFKKRPDFSFFRHGLIPALGIITNVIMLIAIIYLYAIGNADSVNEAKICFYIAGAWGLISFLYVALTSVKKTYSMKMITAIIRPEKLDVLVDVLKEEDLILGMTVTKVKGFGRQKGRVGSTAADKITFVTKLRVEIAVNDWDVPGVMDTMREVLNTGAAGDGKIFVMDMKEAMRVRTGETGVYAV